MTALDTGRTHESMTAKMDIQAMAQETRRRQQATVTGGASTLDDGSTCSRSFRTDDQLVFLYNIANSNAHPKSMRPAFRLLGLFPNVEDAVEHGQVIAQLDTLSAIRVGETHAWYTIAKDTFTDVEPYRLKVNRNLALHQQQLDNFALEFKQRKAFLTKGRVPSYHPMKAYEQSEERYKMLKEWSEAADGGEAAMQQLDASYAAREHERQAGAADGVEETKAGEAAEIAQLDNYVEPELKAPVEAEKLDEAWEQQMAEFAGDKELVKVPRLNRFAEVRNQRFAVVSVVHDYEGNGEEPGFIVWAAFDSEDEALRYNKCVAAKELKDHDLAIVSMYEWVYPHLMNSNSVEQMYRNEELNNIMRNARMSAKRVNDFQRECSEKNVEMPCIEVTADLAAPAPRTYDRVLEETSNLDGSDTSLAPSLDGAC